jgi:hypothetical protein
MKKILLISVAFLAFVLFIPDVSHAQDANGWDVLKDITGAEGAVPDGGFFLPPKEDFGEIGEHDSARVYIVTVLNFILSFLGLIAAAFIIYAGILYITAGGDDAQHGKAKNIIMYTVAGILVILISYALVNTLLVHAPAGTDDRDGAVPIGGNGGGGGGEDDNYRGHRGPPPGG